MTTCSGQHFIELLKKVKYPDVNSLAASNFDWMFEEKDLIPFLETLCFDVQPENILSAEEITQYKEFQAQEFTNNVQIEKLENKEIEEDENKIEENILKLENKITESETYVEMLELQRDSLNIQQLALSEETHKLENCKKSIEKEVMKSKDEFLPDAINKFVDVVYKTSDRIQEISSSLQQSSDRPAQLSKALFQVSVKPYIDSETKILENMNNYLNNSFKKYVTQVNSSVIEDMYTKGEFPKVHTLKSHQVKLAENALYLKDVRQTSCERYAKVIFEESKVEAQMKFLDEFMKKNYLSAYVKPIPHLQNKLHEVNGTFSELEKEKEHLMQRLSSVVQEYLNAKFNWIAVLCCKEKLERYKSYLNLLEKPLDILYDQRSRLEFLNIAMTIEENNLSKLKNSLQLFVKELERETNDNQDRLTKYHKKPDGSSQDAIYVQEHSILYTLNQIMDIFGDQTDCEMTYFTTADVIKKAEKLKSQEEDLIQKTESIYHEQLQLVKAAEANVALFEQHVKPNEKNFEQHPSILIDKYNMKVASLALKLHEFQEEFIKEMNNFSTKKKMIAKNSNISLSRKLFVYALTNPPKFEKAIKEIKERVETYHQRNKKMMKNVYM